MRDSTAVTKVGHRFIDYLLSICRTILSQPSTGVPMTATRGHSSGSLFVSSGIQFPSPLALSHYPQLYANKILSSPVNICLVVCVLVAAVLFRSSV